MALRTSSVPSRIGKGRLDATSTPPSADHAYNCKTESTTPPPLGRNSGMPLTPSSFVTPEAPIQQLPAQTGHNAATPVININASREAAQAAAPMSAEQPATAGSKWKSSSAAATGPVFSVISRGSRLPASSNTSFNPPPPPAKAHGTVARTVNRVHTNRSTPSTTGSTSSSGINLRGLQRTPSTLSSSSSSSCAPTAGHPFGSRISTGRLNSSTSSINSTVSVRSCAVTPIVASSCKSVARVLSFEETEDGAAAAASPARSVRRSSKPTAPAASKNAALDCLQASSAATDDVVRQLDQITSSSNNGSTTWLSGGKEGSSSPLSELEASSAPPAADIFRMHNVFNSTSMATAAAAPLPPCINTASAQAAAKVLLQQLVDSAGGLIAAAGLSGGAALAALLEDGSSTGRGAADIMADSPQESSSDQASVCVNSADNSSSSSLGQLLFDQAATMLEAGATAQQVKAAVLPALLLQLAELAAGNLSKHRDEATETGRDAFPEPAAAAAAAAAGALAVSVQVGLAAAQAAVQGNNSTGNSSNNSTSDNSDRSKSSGSGSPDASRALSASRGEQGDAAQVPKSKKRTALGSLLLLLWSSMLLATGFVAAAVMTVIEAEAKLAGGSGSSSSNSIGFCGVGPGGSYGVAADLCAGVEGAVWPVGGNEGLGWGAAAVQHRRRFGMAHQQ